jgi:cobalt-zinc-cadmium efflux system outer membrane protein
MDVAHLREVLEPRIGQPVPLPTSFSEEQDDARVAELLAQPLSTGAAVEVGLRNSPAIAGDLYLLDLSRAALVKAILPPNPEGSIQVMYGEPGELPNLEIEATEDLGELLRLPLRVAEADARLDAARAEAAGRVLDRIAAIRTAWIDHVAAQQTSELYEIAARSAEASAEIARRMHDAGNLSDLQLANERLLAEDAALTRDAAALAVKTTREALAIVLGLVGTDASWSVPGRLPDPEGGPVITPDLEARVVKASLDLAAADSRILAAERGVALAVHEGLLPRLHGGVITERVAGNWEVGPLIEIEIPLFDQGEAEVAIAAAMLRRLRYQRDEIEYRVRAGARAQGAIVKMAADQATRHRDVLLPLHAEVLERTQVRYNSMLLGVYQLLDARRMQVAAGRAYVAALRTFWAACVDLDMLIAGRLPGGNAGISLDVPGAGSGPQRGH